MITAENADKVRARVVVEAANRPVSPAGDATVSYFEWVQNIQQFRWDEEQVNAELKKAMSGAWKNVHARSTVDAIPLRVAAFAIAVEKVDKAARLRGYV